MPCSQNMNLRLPVPDLPTKADASVDTMKKTIPQQVGAVILCTSCRKEPAEVGGFCIDCDHLMDDVLIDRAGATINRRKP